MCKECFDTGCRCGGIGYTCDGCCDCERGEEARVRRKESIEEIKQIARQIQKGETDGSS